MKREGWFDEVHTHGLNMLMSQSQSRMNTDFLPESESGNKLFMDMDRYDTADCK